MRLIDADALVKALQDDIEGLEEEFPNDKQVKAYKCGVEMALAYIGTEPTIDDVAPVRHGHWVESFKVNAPPTLRSRWTCSWCGNVQTYGVTDYCPNCGADMRGEDE